MDKKWFIRHRAGDELTSENFLRDLRSVEGAPKKEITKVLDYLFEIGYLKEVE